jgi:hypothetical protein
MVGIIKKWQPDFILIATMLFASLYGCEFVLIEDSYSREYIALQELQRCASTS